MAINKKTNTKTNEISYEVKEECGTISTRKGDYALKLRYMSWNGRDEVYDIRPWKVNDAGEEICGKGITLSGEELESLGKLIATMMKQLWKVVILND